jgi:hypothetical protein
MKRICLIITGIIIFWCVFVFASDFSADMVSVSSGTRAEGKIFVSEQKVRTEMAGAVMISRLDMKVNWMIMPDQRMYMEQPFDPKMLSGVSEKMPGEIERTPLGKEMVDGRQADKYRVVYESAKGKESMLQWLDEASLIPVKMSAENGSWVIEYSNLNVGPQDPSLFELPAGYTKMAMPDISKLAGRSSE